METKKAEIVNAIILPKKFPHCDEAVIEYSVDDIIIKPVKRRK